MQLKLVFLLLFTLPILGGLPGCTSKKKSLCGGKKPFSLGLKHGEQGASNLGSYFFKRCEKKHAVENSYNAGYMTGLHSFCSKKRGQSQAAYGLKQEEVCKNIDAYSSGYITELSLKCTPKKAFDDVRIHLVTTNPLCKKVPAYKKKYKAALRKYCSFKKGYQIGYAKKTTAGLCVDAPNLRYFLRGHHKGLRTVYSQENRRISKEIKKSIKARRLLKRRLNKKLKEEPESLSLSKETVDLKLDLNRLESKILSLQSTYETNKKTILNK